MANRDVNPGQGFGATDRQLDWDSEQEYWRVNWRGRPYVSADREYRFYEPGYRYGVESAIRHRGREWRDVEPDLRAGWDRYEYRGENTWEHMKDAVRDAWDRVAHHSRR